MSTLSREDSRAAALSEGPTESFSRQADAPCSSKSNFNWYSWKPQSGPSKMTRQADLRADSIRQGIRQPVDGLCKEPVACSVHIELD